MGTNADGRRDVLYVVTAPWRQCCCAPRLTVPDYAVIYDPRVKDDISDRDNTSIPCAVVSRADFSGIAVLVSAAYSVGLDSRGTLGDFSSRQR